MGNTTQTYLDRYRHDHRARRRMLGVLAVLAAVVAVGVAWGLRSTGIAMTNEVTCGLEEHTHTDECYDEDGNLTCGLEEHTHTVDCLGETSDDATEAVDVDVTDTAAATVTYEATDEGSGVKVAVTASEGALPDGAELSVTLLDESSDAYAEAAEAVDFDADDESTGMAALDIRFTVDGEEVEPSEAVTVSIDASALVGDGATDLAVTHLDESGDSVEAVLVADVTDDTEGTVDEEAATVEFEVESFSTFTITWSSGTGTWSTTYFTITVHHVDEEGNDLTASSSNQTVSINSNNGRQSYDLSDYADSIDGYTYSKATYGSFNGSEVTTATFMASQSYGSTTRTLTLSNSSGTSVYSSTYSNSTVSVDVYLVYKKTGVTLPATAALVDTGEELSGGVESFTVGSGVALDLTSSNANLALSGYTLSYATLTYGDATDTATSVTVTKAEDNTYTVTYVDAKDATQTLDSGLTEEQVASVEVTLWYTEIPSVTITTTKTSEGDGYLLTATTSGFTGEDVTYTWSISTSATSSDYTFVDNGDGTATLTWTDGIKTDEASTLTATISVTASDSTGETATDDVTVSNAVVVVYVFVAGYDKDTGALFSDDMLELLNVSELDDYDYFSAGTVELDLSRLSGSYNSWITADEDWDYVVNQIKTGLVTSNSTTCKNNLIAQYAEQILRDYSATQNQGYSGLWVSYGALNMEDAGGHVDSTGNLTNSGAYRFHLDIRFQTVKITYIYGENGIEESVDSKAYDGNTAGTKVFIQGATMDYTPTITVPDGWKIVGYYTTSDFQEGTEWDAVGQPINEDTTVYIKIVPKDNVVINYVVAEGDGTVTNPSNNDVAAQNGYESFNPTTGSPIGSTATAAEGWEFVGWYLDEGCTTPVTDSWVVDGKITPEAPDGGWTENYECTYYAKFVPISYSVTISKVDSKDVSIYLEGAEFRLYKTETTTVDSVETTIKYYYRDDSGNVTWVTNPDEATTVMTDSDGSATFDYLSIGTYYLEEVSAPDGYNRLSSPIVMTVNSNNTITESDDNASTDGMTITVTNTAGTTLPNTGGTGTTLLTLAGAALVGASACVARRRLRQEGRRS